MKLARTLHAGPRPTGDLHPQGNPQAQQCIVYCMSIQYHPSSIFRIQEQIMARVLQAVTKVHAQVQSADDSDRIVMTGCAFSVLALLVLL